MKTKKHGDVNMPISMFWRGVLLCASVAMLLVHRHLAERYHAANLLVLKPSAKPADGSQLPPPPCAQRQDVVVAHQPGGGGNCRNRSLRPVNGSVDSWSA